MQVKADYCAWMYESGELEKVPAGRVTETQHHCERRESAKNDRTSELCSTLLFLICSMIKHHKVAVEIQEATLWFIASAFGCPPRMILKTSIGPSK